MGLSSEEASASPEGADDALRADRKRHLENL